MAFGEEIDTQEFVVQSAGLDSGLVDKISSISKMNPSLRKYHFKKLKMDPEFAEHIVKQKAELFNGDFENIDRAEFYVLHLVNKGFRRDEILNSPNLTARQSELCKKFLRLPQWLQKKVLTDWEAKYPAIAKAENELVKRGVLDEKRKFDPKKAKQTKKRKTEQAFEKAIKQSGAYGQYVRAYVQGANEKRLQMAFDRGTRELQEADAKKELLQEMTT
jgi:hypothetical protein